MIDRKTPATVTTTAAHADEEDGFHRLVPEWVPRTFAEPTPELTERVAHELRRLADEAK
ncbi:hypothetical protein ACFXKF_02155 [Streptomyces scopuliridis]|uniref:hypothetical protein n=1 Tax=Streptomyces scopuliridis TaxID=452529 RepID=UPI0036C33E8D